MLITENSMLNASKVSLVATTSETSPQIGGAYRCHRREEISIRLSIWAFEAHVLEVFPCFGGLSEKYLTSLIQDKCLVETKKISMYPQRQPSGNLHIICSLWRLVDGDTSHRSSKLSRQPHCFAELDRVGRVKTSG